MMHHSSACVCLRAMYMDSLSRDFEKNSGIQVYKPQYSYLRTINHSYWSYVHQFSYLGGTTL